MLFLFLSISFNSLLSTHQEFNYALNKTLDLIDNKLRELVPDQNRYNRDLAFFFEFKEYSSFMNYFFAFKDSKFCFKELMKGDLQEKEIGEIPHISENNKIYSYTKIDIENMKKIESESFIEKFEKKRKYFHALVSKLMGSEEEFISFSKNISSKNISKGNKENEPENLLSTDSQSLEDLEELEGLEEPKDLEEEKIEISLSKLERNDFNMLKEFLLISRNYFFRHNSKIHFILDRFNSASIRKVVSEDKEEITGSFDSEDFFFLQDELEKLNDRFGNREIEKEFDSVKREIKITFPKIYRTFSYDTFSRYYLQNDYKLSSNNIKKLMKEINENIEDSFCLEYEEPSDGEDLIVNDPQTELDDQKEKERIKKEQEELRKKKEEQKKKIAKEKFKTKIKKISIWVGIMILVLFVVYFGRGYIFTGNNRSSKKYKEVGSKV